ncbi:Cell surface hyaluronidase [Amphibalanus amphitrite]|uniref:Cell surface hyaluronidase n=1 Tax=Amphibalanus amphitrite TaxID=1232801 RepID=A0A6A4WY09_AMPAM|nr:Cell surface hyaluronidase [Amphibalanus amphitrite]
MDTITIADGGKLVFDPAVESLKLSANMVEITGGEFWIGSEDCPYTSEAEVLLTDWQVGDDIVIASTDFHQGQAEQFTLLECAGCQDDQVMIEGPVFFTHWGEETDGVDMRAEVGMLTRKVKIHGEMEDECYGDNLCERFSYDTFGGQIKALRDFSSVQIENAEIYHMGQQSVIGSYPIHFHMCLDTSGKNAAIRQNSIHDTFSRCVTIHGTHNVTLENNVAYNHLGHCYFLEDGGEQHNTFLGNLGFGTKAGTLLPSDRAGRVSTFWITNPDNTLNNNVAAGSDGIGIWILMPLLPTGPSADVDMGLVSGQSLRTALRGFSGNRAHSNLDFGLRLDDILRNDGTFGPAKYAPRVDPTDPRSDFEHLIIDDFTAYKNTEGVWIKSMWTLCTNFRLAENHIGLIFASAGPEDRRPHHEMLGNSRVVGNTDNKGEPAGRVSFGSGQSIILDRSIPRKKGKNAQIGVAFYRGPVHVVDSSFAGFVSNELRGAGAIGKKPSNPYFSSPIASVRNATFDFVDPSGGSRFYDGDGTVLGYKERDGNRHNIVLDWDGSLTTYPLASVVRPIPVLMNARCVLTPNWGPGTAICPDRFSRLKVTGSQPRPKAFVTRDDLQASEVEVSLGEQQVSFSMNTAESYIVHFNTTVPQRVVIIPFGLQQDLYQKVAVCVGASQQITVTPNTYSAADSIAEVDADETNSKYFYDSAVGTVHFRFSNPFPRGEHTTSHCPGTEEDQNGECLPVVKIIQEANNEDGDCRERAYPKYQTTPVSAEGALTVPTFS